MRQRLFGTALAGLAGLALGTAQPAWAQSETEEAMEELATAQAEMFSSTGESLGMVTLVELPQGGVLLQARLEGVPEGEHAFHIHQVGECDPPDFQSAGGHFNPSDVGHGFLDGDGIHAGDLPNVFVQEDGVLHADMVADEVTLAAAQPNGLLTGDGTSLVMHEGPDDYVTDPAGASGPRIACGVIAAAAEAE